MMSFFILLMFAAFAGALLWRKRIGNKHLEFKTKSDLASDEEHAKRLFQESLRKRGK